VLSFLRERIACSRVAEIKPRNRRRLRDKDVETLAVALQTRFGAQLLSPTEHVDRAETSEYDVLLVGQHIVALVLPAAEGAAETIAPSLRLLLRQTPTRSYVTVDMGAVKFVTNGADVMGPGIVEADLAIRKGDLVWIRDERNRRPLAVGEALFPGPELVKQPGKRVRTFHWVGDRIWSWEG